MDYAPVVIFAYNRVDHLKRTIEALSLNNLAHLSNIYIFSDGPKNEDDKEKVKKVREFVSDIDPNLFLSIRTYESETNLGLAISIISGVTKIISKFGKVIVLEDDVITTRDFLDFMNNALNYYFSDAEIWSIGGFSAPINIPSNYQNDIIMTQRVSSFCWATWKDRWEKVDWDIKDYKRFRWNYCQRKSFNRFGNDRSSMLDDQINGRVNSWAIRFDYAMWSNRMYNIIPLYSRASNIGSDGTGTHHQNKEINNDPFNIKLINLDRPIILNKVNINEDIRKEFTKIFRYKNTVLIKRFISNLLYKNIGRLLKSSLF